MIDLSGKNLIFIGVPRKERAALEARVVAAGGALVAQRSTARVHYVVTGAEAKVDEASAFATRKKAVLLDVAGLERVLGGGGAGAGGEGEAAPAAAAFEVAGKKIVLTGAFNTMERDAIARELQKRGAIVSNSVSGKTDLLVAGLRAGSKVKDAQRWGIPVYDEAQLLSVLAAPATVEVAPPPAAEPPPAYTGPTLAVMKGRKVVLTGSFGAFTKAQLKAILEASGATVLASPKSGVTDVISGDKWGRTLREAMAKGANVWTEGEVLLALEGRTSAFPEDHDVPHGALLDALPAVEEGEAEINTPPGVSGRLTLRWKKVAFKTHRRFGEIFGMLYLNDAEHARVGRLYLDGEPLAPNTKDPWYGPESFNMMHFWEDGSDTSGQNLKHSGERGFNCSCWPIRERMHVNWAKWHEGDTWAFEIQAPTAWFGDVCSMTESENVIVDFARRSVAVNHHTGPYVVRPEQPWGQ